VGVAAGPRPELGVLVAAFAVTTGTGGGSTVADAHRLASEIEQTIHSHVPEIHELVIHTEP
jgi:divalent metal cation (Fe/Co/Zn/Cd) transporter